MTNIKERYPWLVLVGLVIVLLLSFLTGCTSTSLYRVAYEDTSEGDRIAKAVKAVSIQGNINGAFTLSTTADGAASLKVEPFAPGSYPLQMIALTDGKGNPMLDKEGQPIFNRIPLVPGLDHATPTVALWDGLGKFARSLGSVIGTIGASLFGIEAANQLGTAATTGVNALTL